MRGFLLLLAILASGTAHAEQAPDAAAVVQTLQAQDQAVEAVGYRLATANADLCSAAKPDPGFLIQTIDQYAQTYRPAAAQILNLSEWPGVTSLAPRSPAQASGLHAGDALTAVNGVALPRTATPPPKPDFGRTETTQRLVSDGFAQGNATLSVLRAGQPLTLEVHAAPACPAAYEVVTDNSLDSDADGARVQISSRMVALAATDDDLAAVLAHELAHNVLRHRARLDALHVSRGLLGQFGRNAILIRQTEGEADRLGIYLLARAGFSLDAAMDFWGRLRSTVWTFGDATHPGWKDRISLMQAEVDRIKATGKTGRQIELPEDLKHLIPQGS
jgi:hypothetical protein